MQNLVQLFLQHQPVRTLQYLVQDLKWFDQILRVLQMLELPFVHYLILTHHYLLRDYYLQEHYHQ